MPSAAINESALNRTFIGHVFLDEESHLTIQSFYAAVHHDLLTTLEEYLVDEWEWKVQACLHITVGKATDERQAHFHIPAIQVQLHKLDDEINEMQKRLEDFTEKGSGWRLIRVDELEWRFVQFNSIPFLVGHSRGFTLPPRLFSKRAVINVNDAPDGECFRYAILSALHYDDIDAHHGRASKYHTWVNELNFTGIQLPFQARDLPRFERQNPSLAINLLEWKADGKAILARGSPVTESRKVLNILLVNTHYVGVVNLNRLFNDKKGHNSHTRKYCERCLRPFYNNKSFDEHLPACKKNLQREYKMPRPEKKCLLFTNWAKTISPSHVLYGDIECMILDDGTHKPIMCGYLVVANRQIPSLADVTPIYHEFSGLSCIQNMLAELEKSCLLLHGWNDQHSRESISPLTLIEQEGFN